MLSVLLVDDDPALLEITRIYLTKNKEMGIDTAQSAAEALEKLKNGTYDVIVSDYDMPVMTGIEFLKTIRTSGDLTPFIIFTGKGQEQVAMEAINNGADFYLIRAGDPKNEFISLDHKIRKAIEQRQADIAIKESEERLRKLLASLPSGVLVIDAETHMILQANPVALLMMGAKEEDILGKTCFGLVCPNEESQCPITDHGHKFDSIERLLLRNDGTGIPVLKSLARITLGNREVLVESFIDLSEQKKIERELHESREKYRTLVEEIHDMIWLIDAKGHFKYVSPRSFTLLGYHPEELIGQLPSLFISFEDANYVSDIFAKNFTEHKELHLIETHTRRKDGRIVVLESSAIPYYAKNGTMLGYRCVSRDITEIKKGEEVQALLAAIVTSSDDAVISEDLHHQITTWNRGAERIYGYTREEMIGMDAHRIVPEEEMGALDDIVPQVIKGEHVEHFNTFRIKKGGGLVEISLSLSPIRDNRGHIVGIATIARDLTKQRETEKALLAYITETAIRLKNPVELIGDRLSDIREQVMAGDVTPEELQLQLQLQIKNTEQIVSNLRELNMAISTGFTTIPEAYQNYLKR
ncbi:MAG: PAS domain S-box protein [Methanomicrobiales archaeon]|nr:PAS domain S-box protein [Methanomicrobiales archaeon]